MRALLLAAVVSATPAQILVIPEGGSACDDAHTHCIVNYSDWARYQDLADENKALREAVRTVKCASVTVTEPSKLARRAVP